MSDSTNIKISYLLLFKCLVIWSILTYGIIKTIEIQCINNIAGLFFILSIICYLFIYYFYINSSSYIKFFPYLISTAAILVLYNIINYAIIVQTTLNYREENWDVYFGISIIGFTLASILYAIGLLFKKKIIMYCQITPGKKVNVIIDSIVLSISIILILWSTLYNINFLQYKPPIPFNNWKTIKISDFRGLKKPNETLDGEKRFAFISTSINITKSRNNLKIESLFHPARSYAYNRNLFSKDLLMHEMYHFHITEYYARLLKQRIKIAVNKKKTFDLENLIDISYYGEKVMQSDYDNDSYHGYVLSKQLEWQYKIDSLLGTLKDYSQSIIIIN